MGELREKDFTNLVQVYAELPKDPVEYQRYFDSVVVDGKPDLESRGEFYQPWEAGSDAIRERIKPIGEIVASSTREQENVKRAIDEYGDAHPNLGVLPVGGIERDVGMLIDQDTLELLGVLDADPWISGES